MDGTTNRQFDVFMRRVLDDPEAARAFRRAQRRWRLTRPFLRVWDGLRGRRGV